MIGNRREFFRAAGVATLALGVLPTSARSAGVSVNIINTGAPDAYVMQAVVDQQHYFDRFGLNAQTANVSDGIKLLASIVQGGSDVAMITGFSQVFPAIEAGARLKLLAGTTIGPDYAVYSGNPAVKTLKDLEGKSVGTGAVGALAYIAMSAMLQKAGVDRDKVRFVNIGSTSDVFKAVLARKIDAGPAQHEFVNDAKAGGLHIIAEAADVIPDFMQQAIFTSEATIAKKRDALVRALAAYGSGYRFIMANAHEDAYIDAFVRGGGTAERGRTKFDWYKQHKIYAVNLQLPEEKVMYQQRLNISLGQQQKLLDYASVTDLSIARDALKLMK